MQSFRALILPVFEQGLFAELLLGQPVFRYICDAISAAGGKVFCAGAFCGLEEAAIAVISGDPEDIDPFFEAENGPAILIFAPIPTLAAEDCLGLLRAAREEGGPVCLRHGGAMVAVAGQLSALRGLIPGGLNSLPVLDAPGLKPALDASGRYAAQKVLQGRINETHLGRGVRFWDMGSAHIGPKVKLEPGCEILPGCIIVGESVVGQGCVIGPNCLLEDAVLGADVRVNASQIYGSSVGNGTTVGPFAYIRPGCSIGERVRIGDFVELKNSNLGDGTKVSHLTYIGDSDFGADINVGCGVITANYDGKHKHRTVVEDGSFIGSNVNLIAPVRVERGAYVTAGTTVTEDVPADALAIGRARTEIKPEWAAKRREKWKKT